MEDFENDTFNEPSELGADDIANDIAQFEARSKQKPSIAPKPQIKKVQQIKDNDFEAERAELKNQVLCDQLYKKTEELKKAKKMVQVIETIEDESEKEKKLIELAKTNRSLKLKLEGAKSQAAKVQEEVAEMKKENERLKNYSVSKNEEDSKENTEEVQDKAIQELRRKVQKAENDLQELTGKNSFQQAELAKALALIRREVGDFTTLDLLLKEEPKAKMQDDRIKELKGNINKQKGMIGKNTSIISHSTNLPAPGVKASEKVFGKTDRKAKEIEKLTNDIKKTDEETKSLKQKIAAANTRIATLDKELKESKLGDVQRVKLLLEKSENADKLIAALKQEVLRLKKLKETMPKNDKPDPILAKQRQYEKERERMMEEMARLKAEIADLKKDKNTLLDNIEEKNAKIAELTESL